MSVLARVYVLCSSLDVQDFNRHVFVLIGTTDASLESVPSSVAQWERVVLVVFHLPKVDDLSLELVLRVEFGCLRYQCVDDVVMVIRDGMLHIVDALSDAPSSVPAVQVVHHHLEVFDWFCCQRKLETSVYWISEFPDLRLRSFAFHCHGVREVPAVVFLEALWSHQRVLLVLERAISPDWQLQWFCRLDVQG